MRAKLLTTVAVATMLLIGGAVAVGATGPPEQANESAPDDQPANGPAGVDAAEDEQPVETANPGNESDRQARHNQAAPQQDRVGPPGGLPEPVPDRVRDIHRTIEAFLNGSIETLGESLQGILGPHETANQP